MTPWLQDADVTLYHGDVLAVLRELPAESVDCCVTSPPYWGLRDYGTGAWEGGDEGCEHKMDIGARASSGLNGSLAHKSGEVFVPYRNTCGKCGATRTDQQLGLEPTPEEYVTRMVEVFREVRRVLASHGTVWLNLGDSYASHPAGNTKPREEQGNGEGRWNLTGGKGQDTHHESGTRQRRTEGIPGLKPKDLVGIPWRVAFALQADGWYLRSDIIWAKPNPMPESVTDRPTKAHEYVFLLSKQAKYHFDQEAVRERWADERYKQVVSYDDRADRGKPNRGTNPDFVSTLPVVGNPAGRNIRSVWEIATQPYPEAHFATFPEELARRCIAAGCPEEVCRYCGKARERQVNVSYEKSPVHGSGSVVGRHYETGANNFDGAGMPRLNKVTETAGWTDCECVEFKDGVGQVISKYRTGVTLDPFIGSGTVAHVARKLGRHAVGIDLNESYLELAARRLQQQSLFAEATSGL